MIKNDYTVSEIAEKLNISKVTVYNRLKELKVDLKPFLKTLKGVKYIDQQGFDMIQKSIFVLSDESKSLNNENTNLKQEASNQEMPSNFKTLNSLLQNENEYLKQQLKEKHEYIKLFQNELENKNKQIEELNKALNQSQTINENNQILIRESQQRVLLLENQEKQDGFFKRLFYKN